MVADDSKWLDDENVTTELAVARVRELEKKLRKDRGTGIVAQLRYHLERMEKQLAATEQMLDSLDRIEDGED